MNGFESLESNVHRSIHGGTGPLQDAYHIKGLVLMQCKTDVPRAMGDDDFLP
jgi:hypothetical protein